MFDLKGSFLVAALVTTTTASAFIDSSQTVMQYIQKTHFDGKTTPLLANEEKALPFKQAIVYRVVNPGASNQGWRVWLSLADQSVHPIETSKTLLDYLKSIETPLSSVHLRKNDLAQAKRISNRLLMLFPSPGAKVDCKKSDKGFDCSLQVSQDQMASLSFDTRAGKITVRP